MGSSKINKPVSALDPFPKKGGQLNTLRFTTRKCRRALSKRHITQPNILKRLKFCFDFSSRCECQKRQLHHRWSCLKQHQLFCHVKLNFQHLFFKAFPITVITRQLNVCHELHFDGDSTFAFTSVATASINIEMKNVWVGNFLKRLAFVSRIKHEYRHRL